MAPSPRNRNVLDYLLYVLAGSVVLIMLFSMALWIDF